MLQDGKVSQLEHVFIRGSKVRCILNILLLVFPCINLFEFLSMLNSARFMVIPDMLKNAPMFKRLEARIKVQLC